MKYSIELLMSLVGSGKLPVLLDGDIQVILDSIMIGLIQLKV